MNTSPNLPVYPGGIPYPPGMSPQKAAGIIMKAGMKHAKGAVHNHGGKRSNAGRRPATLMQTVTRAFGSGGAKK